VQQAFYEYLADNHLLFPALSKSRYRNMPELISKLHYVYLNEAVKLLGTSEKRLRLMIRSGRLTSYNEMDKSRFILVKREDVLELRKRWEQALDLKEAANWLGLSRELVPQLVKVGLLAAQQTTAEGLSWMFSPSDVTECLERVTERVGSYSSLEIVNNEEMLSLKRTSSLLRNKLGLGSLALALQKVADGDLPAYILANSKLQLRSLIFARSDIDAYIEAEKAEQGWIDREEVASILGITRQSLISWVKTGLISPATTEGLKYYFNRQEIEKLKSDLMLTTEAFETLGISRWALYSLVQQGRLNALRGPAVDGYRPYVFSRESLLEWRQNRLTLHEAQHQLEISNTELVSWVKQGKLLPIEDKTLHPWYFSRQHISSIGERTRPGQP